MESRTVKCKGAMNNHILHKELVFRNVFKRRESHCCAVLMKNCRRVKGEQMVQPKTLMMYQDNYFVISVKLNFC